MARLLDAETAVQPVLLVLEDLHWGDFDTVRFLDAALRDRRDRPWMVLALSRPEVFEVFPQLWTPDLVCRARSASSRDRPSIVIFGDALDDRSGYCPIT